MYQDEEDSYVATTIRRWVWAGFYSEEDVEAMLDDLIEDEGEEENIDEAEARALVVEEFERKFAAEDGWPDTTDCDRLDEVFEGLLDEGICAVANAGYTLSEGFTEVAEALHERGSENFYGYCFYHGQDVEHAVDGHGLMLAFGDLNDNQEKARAVGRTIFGMLVDAGFEPEWDGTVKNRISLRQFDWKRRLRRGFF